ncbi:MULTISPECIES: VOC family protein [Halostella]|uniref:VOC family protein n=1 Tax=Halostella TaxID=1843185 RepID=UPI0010808AA7|nr:MULTISPECIES: VOC family protein [Halostella]
MSESRPTQVGHVHLKVRDVSRSVQFYTDVLGLEVEDEYGQFAFLSWGKHHHDVALQGVGEDAPGPGPGIGLYHAAFEVETADALRAVYRRLRDREVTVTPVDHGISKALYFDDPDGNGMEVYLDTRTADHEAWEGQNRRFDPEAL